MLTLLFEMTPRDGHEENYFDHVAVLRPILAQHQGLLFIQRYKSLSRPGVILSHQLWRDEASIIRWRSDKDHHTSQIAGRYKHFTDYRIRVSRVLYFYTEQDDQKSWNTDDVRADANNKADRFVTIVRSSSLPTSVHGEVFESVSETNSFLCLSESSEPESGHKQCLAAQTNNDSISVAMARVSRDYGMQERTEAPQHFKPVGD